MYFVVGEAAYCRVRNSMNFTFQFFTIQDNGEVLPFLSPLTLDFPSVAVARAMISKVLDHEDMPAHSVTITSEDGSISERLFWLDGEWRRKDA